MGGDRGERGSVPRRGAEGVIKFSVGRHRRVGPLPEAEWAELDSWRSALRARGLVGLDGTNGLGYGNLSVRRAAGGFLITGSQTGGLERLDGRHYVIVEAWDFAANRVDCAGTVLPSSESLSHAALYAANPAIGAVVHVHARSLWRSMLDSGDPSTPADVPYGSVALYTRLGAMALARPELPSLIAIAGHEDGIVAAGGTPADACGALFARMEREDRWSGSA